MSVTVSSYLGFNGTCREAVDKYISAFGGQIRFVSFWGQENCGDPARWGKVMHMEFDPGSTPISAGDPPEHVSNDGAVRLMIRMESREEALRAVETLAEAACSSRLLLPSQARCQRHGRHREGRLRVSVDIHLPQSRLRGMKRSR